MIRKMQHTKDEINQVMSIWLESTIKAHYFIPKTYWQKSYHLVKETYIPQSETYVYAENKEILAFISIIDEEYIGALFVASSQQGKGIGRKLTEYCQSKYGALSLAVYKENSQAVDFYKKNGFKCVREQLNEDTHEAEYIMVSDIVRKGNE